MRITELFEAMDVPHLPMFLAEDRMAPLGQAPSSIAQLCWHPRRQKVLVVHRVRKGIPEALHEAVHAVVGPRSFNNDMTGMIAYEWLMMNELNEEDFAVCREAFADYPFIWYHPETGKRHNTIGHDGAVFMSNEWDIECQIGAVLGFVAWSEAQLDWVPVFGHGVSDEWGVYIEKRFPTSSCKISA